MVPPPALAPGRVAGVVFDLDGTLVDSYRAITDSLNLARAGFGLPPLPEALVRRKVGHGLESLIAELVGADRVEEGVRRFRERYAQVYASGTDLLPGALEVCRALSKRGYRLAVASNKPARFCTAILEALALAPYFGAVYGPDRAGVAKPHPAMVEACLHDLGVARERALYVGDMVLDVETAARAGLPVVLVPGGSSERPELEATGQPVLPGLSALLDLLPARPGGDP